MAKKNLLELNLENFKQQLKTLPVTRLNELESIASAIHQYCYSTYEYLGEKFPGKIETMLPVEAKEAAKDLRKLNKQIVSLMDVLCGIDIEGKNLLRVQYMFGELEEEIPELIKQLKKVK